MTEHGNRLILGIASARRGEWIPCWSVERWELVRCVPPDLDWEERGRKNSDAGSRTPVRAVNDVGRQVRALAIELLIFGGITGCTGITTSITALRGGWTLTCATGRCVKRQTSNAYRLWQHLSIP